MKGKKSLAAALVMLLSAGAFAQNNGTGNSAESTMKPKINGTVRAKYEYQPTEGAGRFEVRNARLSVSGKVTPIVAYKAEIDLSDEGTIKMLDAYTRITPFEDFNFTIGQMRVPFTIDAHRSPHQQYFANRSFIAKQVGNVRDVGATLGYRFGEETKVVLDAGIFNGSGLTNQKNFWTKEINFSAKAQLITNCGFNAVASIQKISPAGIDIVMYDGGVFYENKNWHAELEYLYKSYENNSFDGVHAVDAFVNYNQWFNAGEDAFFRKISYLARLDMMGDHSDGKLYEIADPANPGNVTEALKINDYARKRLTGGVTLSFAKKGFVADIRINYEKYFYNHNATVKTSEHDKFVIEFMTRF